MSYVDGFLLPISKSKLKAYRRMAEWGRKTWMKHGAVDYKECVGDDLEVKYGLPYPRLMKLRKGETVVFAFIVYRSRAHRDRVNARVMKELQSSEEKPPADMPFDVRRMGWGGFRTIVGR
jgi:uncharacterized protein YbaA (DUF1428 family)